MKKKLVPVVILTFILVICCIVFIAPSKSGDNPNDSALLQKIILIVTLLIIILLLVRKVFGGIPLSKKWIGGIAGGIAIMAITILVITNWDELGFRKEPPPAPENSIYHQASTPTSPEIHVLKFGENRMKLGEIWCFTGDQRTRHYALKDTSALRGSVIVKIWSERKGDFEEEFKLITENGMEQDPELYYKIGQIYCSYTHYVSVDKEATILVTDPTEKM